MKTDQHIQNLIHQRVLEYRRNPAIRKWLKRALTENKAA